jgi:glycosyltransferase involved in cell wall biosynthesis
VVRRFAFAVPGDLATPTGGYAYDRRIIEELRQLDWQVDVVDLGSGFPRADAERKVAAGQQLAGVPTGLPIVIDGLAYGVLPEAAEQLRERNPLIALVHHPLALETGLAPADAEALFKSEQSALAAARAVIVTSPSTEQILLDDYDVSADCVTVAYPGTDRGVLARGSSDGVVRLISIGAIVPRKGFDVLMAALAKLSDLPWRLAIAGDLTRDPATAAQLRSDIQHYDLGSRVELLGVLPQDRIAALHASSDIFVLPSRFEGYGMAFAEAMAHGLPVVGTTAGAIPDTVPPEAGVLVEPNDVKALVRALRMLIEKPQERRWFAAGARAAGERLPTWRESAERFAGAIEALG